MTKWTCTSCNEITLTINPDMAPRFCTHCGKSELVRVERIKAKPVEEIKQELIEVINKMNALDDELVPLRKQYTKLAQQLRQRKTAGSISKEDFDAVLSKYNRSFKNTDEE